MDVSELKTVEKIAEFTKKKVEIYRQYPEKKDIIIGELAPLFSSKAEGWKVVLDTGKFRKGFTRVLGVGRMKALKKLLCELDRNKYQKCDFGIDDGTESV
jgi:hypothetical protein